MFDIGWSELLVIAVIAILVVGPKELPRMLHAIGQAVGKVRRQADEFRRQFNESMREAGMDDVQKGIREVSNMNPARQVKSQIESAFDVDGKTTPKPAEGKPTAPEDTTLNGPPAPPAPPPAPSSAGKPASAPATDQSHAASGEPAPRASDAGQAEARSDQAAGPKSAAG